MAEALPDYLRAARPVPAERRSAWYLTTAQTYASVMLWFAFWEKLASGGGTPGGTLSAGLGVALLALLVAGLLCHFLFYLVPGLLGMKTGLPLYVVGTSTYGARGGLIMPGLLMGILQFGWIGVNAYAVSALLYKCFGLPLVEQAGELQAPVPNPIHAAMAIVFAVAVALVGLKGIRYVARVASFFPLIPLAVLVILFVNTAGGLSRFSPSLVTEAKKPAAAAGQTAPDAATKHPGEQGQQREDRQEPKSAAQPSANSPQEPKQPLSAVEVVLLLCTVVIGFFATAGAAGADLAMNNRNAADVHLGGLTGIALATLVAGGLSVATVAGAYGAGMVRGDLAGNLNPLDLMSGGILNPTASNTIMILLAISSFPGGCFSAYIAATSFKTTMPRVNPFLSVGLGTLVSIFLAVSGWAGKVIDVFQVIGASFGPICGAMAADYLLSGRKWAGPRTGFNPAGWISWAVGFFVGAADLLAKYVPALAGLEGVIPVPPLSAFVVGFVLYFVLARLGLETRTIPLGTGNQNAPT